MISVLIEESMGDCGSPEDEHTTQPGIEGISEGIFRESFLKECLIRLFKGK